MTIVGRTYLEDGQPVRVLARWRTAKESRAHYADAVEAGWIMQEVPKWPDGDGVRARLREGPRNVLIRRADGTLVVRPFRGLRKGPRPYLRPAVDAVMRKTAAPDQSAD